MHDKNAWKLKIKEKGGYKGLTSLRWQKPLKKFGGKRQKSCFDPWTDRIERKRVLKKVWIVKNMWETQF